MSFQKTARAIGDPTRREILNLLKAGPMSAGAIGEHFKTTGPTLSHHLSILKESELILDVRKGKHIYYELNMTVLDEILNWMTSLRN